MFLGLSMFNSTASVLRHTAMLACVAIVCAALHIPGGIGVDSMQVGDSISSVVLQGTSKQPFAPVHLSVCAFCHCCSKKPKGFGQLTYGRWCFHLGKVLRISVVSHFVCSEDTPVYIALHPLWLLLVVV